MPARGPAFADPNPWRRPDPMPSRFETDRFILRPLEHADAESLLQAIEVDRDSLLPWLPWARDNNRTIAECHYSIEMFRRDHLKPDCTFHVMTIIEESTGKVVGGTGVHNLDPATHTGETGYWVRADRRGEGIATEAVGAMISWCLTPADQHGWGLRRMTILCAEINEPSVRVARTLGLRLEKRAIDARFLDGLGYHTELGFAILNHEWDFTAHRAKPGIPSGIAPDNDG